jgi:tetratricopeptide (TPR) repeat protein
MQTIKNKFIALALLSVSGAFLLNACGSVKSVATDSRTQSLPPAAPIASNESATDNTIRFLENRLKNDPEDYSANNKLAGLYLQKLRETGNVQYLDLTFRVARISLDSVPELRNSGGLAALALAEFASHDFTGARDHAARLTELDPGKSYPQGILGDALVELGEYEKAEIAYKKITLLDGGSSYVSETRFARLAQLHGDNQSAQKHFATALALALNQTAPPREAVAWCRWQLGETAFSVGDYETAEKNYTDALVTFPDYYRAIASLGSLLAARGDLPGAISQYEKVVLILPDPTYIAALGNLYKLAGREEDAGRQYELVEKIGHLSELNGALYNRQLALFYADHDIKTEDAYRLATKEYETRRDIYGADALAWTALKTGKLTEAQAAMKDALRLGTKDARLFYHAGMIEKAAGNNARAADYLQKALKLNPAFDPLQAVKARAALEELK